MYDPDDDILGDGPQEMIESRPDATLPDGRLDLDDDHVETLTSVPLHRRKAADDIDPDNPETWGRVPRNATCPCGSGNKYKHCHGKVA